MIIDEKGKLFGKVNLLDLILVVIILAVIAAACILFAGGPKAGATLPVTYTVEIQNKDEAYFAHVVEGETVTDGITGVYVGKIKDFEKKPAVVLTQADNRIVAASPEGRYDGYVQIEVEAGVSYPDLLASDIELKIGSEIAFRSESLAMHGYIVAVDYDAAQLEEVR